MGPGMAAQVRMRPGMRRSEWGREWLCRSEWGREWLHWRYRTSLQVGMGMTYGFTSGDSITYGNSVTYRNNFHDFIAFLTFTKAGGIEIRPLSRTPKTII
jgi:hypothetical protein